MLPYAVGGKIICGILVLQGDANNLTGFQLDANIYLLLKKVSW